MAVTSMNANLLRKAGAGLSEKTIRYGLIFPVGWWSCMLGLVVGGASFFMDASGFVNMDVPYAAPGATFPSADAGSGTLDRFPFRKWGRKSGM